MGEAQLAYFSLPLALAEYYPILKKQILRQCWFFSCQVMTEFHCWAYQADVNPHSQMDKLLKTTKHWLQSVHCSAVQVVEWIAMD